MTNTKLVVMGSAAIFFAFLIAWAFVPIIHTMILFVGIEGAFLVAQSFYKGV